MRRSGFSALNGVRQLAIPSNRLPPERAARGSEVATLHTDATAPPITSFTTQVGRPRDHLPHPSCAWAHRGRRLRDGSCCPGP
jgi:hypothetical protein